MSRAGRVFGVAAQQTLKNEESYGTHASSEEGRGGSWQ